MNVNHEANVFGMSTNGVLGKHTAGETFVGYAGRKMKNGYVNYNAGISETWN